MESGFFLWCWFQGDRVATSFLIILQCVVLLFLNGGAARHTSRESPGRSLGTRRVFSQNWGICTEFIWNHLKERWRRRYKLFIIMKDIMKEHIRKTTFDSWPPKNSNLHNIFGSHLLFLKHVYCFYTQKICLYTSGLVCEDGSELPDDAIWTSATGPDTLQMVPWLTALDTLQ